MLLVCCRGGLRGGSKPRAVPATALEGCLFVRMHPIIKRNLLALLDVPLCIHPAARPPPHIHFQHLAVATNTSMVDESRLVAHSFGVDDLFCSSQHKVPRHQAVRASLLLQRFRIQLRQLAFSPLLFVDYFTPVLHNQRPGLHRTRCLEPPAAPVLRVKNLRRLALPKCHTAVGAPPRMPRVARLPTLCPNRLVISTRIAGQERSVGHGRLFLVVVLVQVLHLSNGPTSHDAGRGQKARGLGQSSLNVPFYASLRLFHGFARNPPVAWHFASSTQ